MAIEDKAFLTGSVRIPEDDQRRKTLIVWREELGHAVDTAHMNLGLVGLHTVGSDIIKRYGIENLAALQGIEPAEGPTSFEWPNPGLLPLDTKPIPFLSPEGVGINHQVHRLLTRVRTVGGKLLESDRSTRLNVIAADELTSGAQAAGMISGAGNTIYEGNTFTTTLQLSQGRDEQRLFQGALNNSSATPVSLRMQWSPEPDTAAFSVGFKSGSEGITYEGAKVVYSAPYVYNADIYTGRINSEESFRFLRPITSSRITLRKIAKLAKAATNPMGL